jgi:hypothetical protein
MAEALRQAMQIAVRVCPANDGDVTAVRVSMIVVSFAFRFNVPPLK